MKNYRNQIELFIQDTLDMLYPVRLGRSSGTKLGLFDFNESLKNILYQNPNNQDEVAEETCKALVDYIPKLRILLDKDIEAIYHGDPAAVDYNEIVIAYPGFYAIAAYRIANFLLSQGIKLIPRIITEHAHSYTGVDIHPAATIGEYLCIDHGTGVVIGETAIIGDHVKIYQGVTLGALSITKKEIKGQRHPTIGNNVVIYAQATILGGDTIIGNNSIIGGNVWITKSVAPHSKIYYKQASEISNARNMKAI